MTKLQRVSLCSFFFDAIKIKYEKHGKFASIYTIPKCPTSIYYKFPEHSTENYLNFRIDLYMKSFLISGPIIFGHEKLTCCCYFINKTRTKVAEN